MFLKDILVSAIIALSNIILISAFAFKTPKTYRYAYDSSASILSSRSAMSLNAKKILIAFDGSGNNARSMEPSEIKNRTFTNILRLHLLAGGDINGKRSDVDGQISLYQRGIGGMTKSAVLKKMMLLGGDLIRQTKPMRKKLEAVYEPGDKLYIIGFSRGAASARKLACEINKYGLRTKKHGKIEKPSIEFLGCFDTISYQIKRNLLGVIRDRYKKQITKSTVLGENGKVPPNVNQAVHHVAMDDNRQWGPVFFPFPPILMGAEENVHEVWFPGIHGDIGGKFYDRGLNDVSCMAMKEWMQSLGLKFIEPGEVNKECLAIDGYPKICITTKDLCINPNSAAEIHYDFEWQIKTDKFTPSYRVVHAVKDDETVPGGIINVHESLLLHMEAMKEKGTQYAVNPNLKGKNIVVVTSLGTVLDDETNRLVELLESDY